MEIKIDPKKQVEAVIRFKKPRSFYEISDFITKSIEKSNRILAEKRKEIPFLRRIFTLSDKYSFKDVPCYYCSYDGKSPMIRAGSYFLDSEQYPDAKYETRHLMFIVGLRNAHLFFDVIPGIAEEDQFGTEMVDTEIVPSITIKANLESNLYWKKEQAKFLELFVPILEKMDQERK